MILSKYQLVIAHSLLFITCMLNIHFNLLFLSRYPVTILTLPGVSQAARRQLRILGAQLYEVPMLQYPFKITEARKVHFQLLELTSTESDNLVYGW